MRTTAYFVRWALLALLVGAIAYGYGFWSGRFLDLGPTSGYCPAKPLAFPATTWTWFPLTDRCHYTDGSTTELVPVYVNPILFTSLAAAVVCVVLAVRAARRDRANPLTTEE